MQVRCWFGLCFCFFFLCRHKRFEENTPLERYPCTSSPGLGVFLHRPIVEKLLHLIVDRDKIKKVFFGPSMTSSMFAVVWFNAWKRKKLEALFICLLYILSTGLCLFGLFENCCSTMCRENYTQLLTMTIIHFCLSTSLQPAATPLHI